LTRAIATAVLAALDQVYLNYGRIPLKIYRLRVRLSEFGVIMWEKVKQNAFGVVVYSVAAFFAAWGAIQASEAVASTPGGAQNNVIAAGLAWALPMVAIWL
jgi:hypothetical protein